MSVVYGSETCVDFGLSSRYGLIIKESVSTDPLYSRSPPNMVSISVPELIRHRPNATDLGESALMAIRLLITQLSLEIPTVPFGMTRTVSII